MGKTAAETIAVMMAVLKRLTMPMRGSVTFDKLRQQASGANPEGTEVSRSRRDSSFARHTLLRGLLGTTTYFCDAPHLQIWASWQEGGVENANSRIRRWLPRTADLDGMAEAAIQQIAMPRNFTPSKWLGFKSPVEAFLAELGRGVEIGFHGHGALGA